ncbi:hypothetical protein ACP70R_004645 [Stipagrostis hirtigluma subsp. patula]
MAPSIKSILIAMLVAFAVASPAAEATRAQGEAAAAPAPGEAVLHLSAMPLIPLIPCSWVPDIPFIKDILHLFCYDDKPAPPAPPPRPCRAPLLVMAKPCAPFVTTNASVAKPPGACCVGYLSVIHTEILCLCRVANGDIVQLLPAPVNMTRVYALPDACGGDAIHLEDFANCERDGIKVPPMDDPSPSPPAH